ncbi:MAG: DUF177 domain-containing protein [Pacificimonas sp.]
MSAPEFSRIVKLDEIGNGIERRIEATAIERAALAVRFGLVTLDELTARLTVAPGEGGFRVTGPVSGRAVASCVVSAEDVAQTVDEQLALTFVRELPDMPDEDVELSLDELDIVSLGGARTIDLGEVAAEAFVLALDPFPRASDEDIAAARALLMSEEDVAAEAAEIKRKTSPFAALK